MFRGRQLGRRSPPAADVRKRGGQTPRARLHAGRRLTAAKKALPPISAREAQLPSRGGGPEELRCRAGRPPQEHKGSSRMRPPHNKNTRHTTCARKEQERAGGGKKQRLGRKRWGSEAGRTDAASAKEGPGSEEVDKKRKNRKGRSERGKRKRLDEGFQCTCGSRAVPSARPRREPKQSPPAGACVSMCICL